MNSSMIQTFVVSVIPLLLAITLHEAAHAYAAKHFGDKTAWLLGRVTLNPLKHIDLIGTILMPLGLLLASGGAFSFGYAKPVPVNFSNLRNPKKDMVWVAFAGPAINLVQAFAWAILWVFAKKIGLTEEFFLKMMRAGVWINVIFFVFNLLPLPPLDGGRILVGLLPREQSNAVARIEPYGFMIVIGLLLTNILDKVWLYPISAIIMDIISSFTKPFI